MDDRQLLELAAKAAGIEGDYEPGDDHVAPCIRHDDENDCMQHWAPLTDDGDALRLAVNCGIKIEPSPRGCSVMWRVPQGLRVETVLCSTIGQGPDAATRRAIVRAAAAIQQAKESSDAAE